MTLARLCTITAALLFVGACNQSGFSSQSGKKERVVKQTSDSKPVDDEPKLTKPKEPDEPSDVLPAVTTPVADGAVTKGSFTAWAEPARPRPTEAYWIHIEVRLPSNMQDYTQYDLTGSVIGTDQYERGIGRDSQGPGGIGGDLYPDQFQFLGDKAKIAVWVPGAQFMVRDTIKIRSDVLNESQTIEIIFQ